MIVLLIVFCCVGCDQVTKRIASHNLQKRGSISLLNDTFRLQYAENSGGFLSLGAVRSKTLQYAIFRVVVGVFLLGLAFFLVKAGHKSTRITIALALVLGGGIGNLIDRIFNEGRVIDFVNIGVGSIRTGIFNVADIAITFGVLLFVLFSLSRRNGSRKST